MGQIAFLPSQDKADRIEVARNVKAHIAFAGETGSSMARKIGMTQSSMSRRTTAADPFDIDELGRIARTLSVTIADLITGNLPNNQPGDYPQAHSATVTPLFAGVVSA